MRQIAEKSGYIFEKREKETLYVYQNRTLQRKVDTHLNKRRGKEKKPLSVHQNRTLQHQKTLRQNNNKN